mmetsp:Transcript_102737/g.235678  ORF Transcript_102737/g.235678 Transcript_102737/m.235678 type:complete len:299 (-) Transcript_102737:3-899(-)
MAHGAPQSPETSTQEAEIAGRSAEHQGQRDVQRKGRFLIPRLSRLFPHRKRRPAHRASLHVSLPRPLLDTLRAERVGARQHRHLGVLLILRKTARAALRLRAGPGLAPGRRRRRRPRRGALGARPLLLQGQLYHHAVRRLARDRSVGDEIALLLDIQLDAHAVGGLARVAGPGGDLAGFEVGGWLAALGGQLGESAHEDQSGWDLDGHRRATEQHTRHETQGHHSAHHHRAEQLGLLVNQPSSPGHSQHSAEQRPRAGGGGGRRGVRGIDFGFWGPVVGDLHRRCPILGCGRLAHAGD